MKKLTQIKIAKLLCISHSNFSQWKTNKKIPAEKCMSIAPILRKELKTKITAENLFKNPALLFDLINNTNHTQSVTKKGNNKEVPRTSKEYKEIK